MATPRSTADHLIVLPDDPAQLTALVRTTAAALPQPKKVPKRLQ